MELFDAVTDSITQDKSGYLWVGTQSGLFRYDGNELKPFKHDPTNSNSVSGSWVNNLEISQENKLWIGTRFNGISVYDPVTDTFTRYQHDSSQANSLPSDSTRALLVDKQGGVWVGTTNGLCRIDRSSGDIKIFKQALAQPKTKPTKNTVKKQDHNSIESLYIDRKNTLWVGHEAGLSHLDLNTGNYKLVDLFSSDGKLWQGAITYIFQTNDGQIWLGTLNHGLARLSQNQRLDFYPVDADNPLALNHPYVTDLIQIGSKLWVATNGGGISIIDIPSKKLERTIRATAEHKDAGASNIAELFVDDSGLLWSTTLGGLFKYNLDAATFTLLRNHPDDPRTLS